MGGDADVRPAAGAGPRTDRGSRAPAAGRRRAALLGLGVTACLALGLSACTAAPEPTPGPVSAAPTASASASTAPTAALVDTVFSRLPEDARSAPAFTWDSAGRIGQGQAGEDGDDVLLLAAACDGGGALTITVNGRATVLDCSQSAATGPINVSAAIATDAPSGVELTVRPSAGHPRYVAKAVSVRPEQATASAS